MKINLYIYSMTGNSLSVAQKLVDDVIAPAHTYEISRIKPNDDQQMDIGKILLAPMAGCSNADMIVIGGPVHAFRASPAMVKAAVDMKDLRGKPAAIFVTEALPYDWMGGRSAIRKIEKILTENGANVISTGIIHWNRSDRQRQIDSFFSAFRRTLS